MVLSLEHVAKTHWVGPYEKRTLAGASLALHAGDFVGVWGAHRAGKSTLARIAAGIEPPDEGVARFEGEDLAALPARRRGALRLGPIALVQRAGPHSRELPVGEHVALPLLRRCTRAEARRGALEALRRVDVLACRDALWHELSDCERALVSLAHGLVRAPRLLIADDPAGGLDPDQEREVVELLRAVAADGVAVLMTASALSAAAQAQAAYTLGDGRLEAVADPSAPSRVVRLRRDAVH